MSDAGYTLVEALVALVMIGLAMGGLTLGVGVIAQAQSRATDTIAVAAAGQAAQKALEDALQAQGAFRSADGRLTGGGQGFGYACGEAAPCRVDLSTDARGLGLTLTNGRGVRRAGLRARGGAHFVYQGTAGTYKAWPPTDPQRQALRSVLLVRNGGEEQPLLAARLWAEQPGPCAFDAVMQDCR